MSLQLFLLIIVVITALAFDFTNGFHDTGNAMATSIASGALAPKVAVALSAVLNLLGAFLSTAVAATIAKDLVDSHLVTLELVFAGLVGGIVWNLMTWLLGIPSSSSHALIGGIVGATIAAVGGHGVIWRGLVSHVVIPAIVAAIVAIAVGAVGTWLVYRIIRGTEEKRTEKGFRRGQIGSASLVSLAHGTSDGQKTMGVIFLALMSYGAISKTSTMPPFWVITACAVAMAAGHLHRRLAHHPHPRQGTRRHQITTGDGRGIVVGRNHLALRPVRLRPVDHSGGDRIGTGQRNGQTRSRGALVGGRPDGSGVAHHPAVGRPRRRIYLHAGSLHRRLPGRHHRLQLVDRCGGGHLPAVSQVEGRPQQRQR